MPPRSIAARAPAPPHASPPYDRPLVVAHTAFPGGAAPAVVHRVIGAPPSLAALERRYGPNVRTVLLALARTDPTLQATSGGATTLAPADWITFAGASLVLAQFIYPPAPGIRAASSRFSNGAHGVWYAASTRAGAQAEVGHHMALDFAAGLLGPGPIPRLVVHATLSPVYPLVDLRGLAPPPDVRHPTDYTDAQGVGAACRAGGQWGVLWQSVRWPTDLCVGILRPPAVTAAWIHDACAATWDPGATAYGWV